MTCTSDKCMNYLSPWFPSLSLCLRCAMSEYMVVAMQRRCERYIMPALKFNNIISATAVHSIMMLCQGVAVAVFPTYMGEYVACVCVLTNTRACRSSSSIKRVFIAALVCVLPPLQTKLHHHHRHVHLAVRGEDLVAEERNKAPLHL